jgi:O-succinylbenzoate synthase
MPLVHFFETSFGRTTHRRILLVEVESQGATGWGEVTTGELPFYNEEWVDGSWLLLRDIIGPRMLGREIGAAADVARELPPVRGHRMTAGGLEAAVWDLEARMLGVPLWAHIGGSRVDVACGVSIGIQDNVDQLLGLIEREVAAGYRRVKIKIKPGWDVDVARRVRESYPDLPLMVDANSAYTLADTEHLRQLDAFNLMMIEQPLAHDDIIDHAKLQEKLQTAPARWARLAGGRRMRAGASARTRSRFAADRYSTGDLPSTRARSRHGRSARTRSRAGMRSSSGMPVTHVSRKTSASSSKRSRDASTCKAFSRR